MHPEEAPRLTRVFSWINTHLKFVVIAVLVVTLPAVALAANRSTDEPQFNATGGIFDIQEDMDERFESSSSIQATLFVVEAGDGNVLSQESLLAILEANEAVRSNADLNENLLTTRDREMGVTAAGLWSLAEAVDAELDGDLAAASESEVQAVLRQLLDPEAGTSVYQNRLSGDAALGANGWEAKSLLNLLIFDDARFTSNELNATDQLKEQEAWLRDVQTELRGEDSSNEVVGVALDENLTFEEQGLTAGPFIALGVIMILLLVSILLRSYWAGAVVTLGLAISIIQFQAVMTMLGMNGGLLLGIVVPISAISFGVDFFVHATGRVREELAAGTTASNAYPRGLTAVFGAILLALVSSGVAFLANTTAGIEAITEFGIGAAVALTFSFLYLGILAPRVLLALESGLLPRRNSRPTTVARWVGLIAMTLFAGLTVATTVVMPVAGATMLAGFVVLSIVVPQRSARRRARQHSEIQPADLGSAGHRIPWIGNLVETLARRRYVTLGVTALLSAFAFSAALNVNSGADISDFLSAETDFVTGIQKIGDDFPSGSGRPGVIIVEGDLTSPDTLRTLDSVYENLSDSLPGEAIVRDTDGAVSRGDDAVTLVRATMATPIALAAVEATSGVQLTDSDSDGLADNPEQILAIYSVARTTGLPADDGTVLFTPGDVEEFLFLGDDVQSTTLLVMVPVPEEDASGVFLLHDVLRAEAANLTESNNELTSAEVAGIGITEERGYQSFTDAMALSLPLALLLCLIVAAGFMRSVRYGVASVLPILLVVTWLYAFMEIAGYRINAVTATLAAIAVGVGIDYATHFTMRFREEMEHGVTRLTAMNRAGAGTGGALTISALSSILGFLALSLAPMPVFAVYGLLTAIMISFSLAMSLLVLPSILMVVTPARANASLNSTPGHKDQNFDDSSELLQV